MTTADRYHDSGRSPGLLAYASSADAPLVSHSVGEVRIDLGRSTRSEAVTALVMAGLAVVWPIAYLMGATLLTGGVSWAFEDLVIGVLLFANLVFAICRLGKVARDHNRTTEIVLDGRAVSSRGPRAGTARIKTATVGRFVVRRCWRPWWFRLDARRLPGQVSEGNHVLLAVTKSRQLLLAAADRLNETLGPVPCSTAAESRARRWRRYRAVAIFAGSLPAAGWLLFNSFALPGSRWIRSDVFFVLAFSVAIAPCAIYLQWASRERPGPAARPARPSQAAGCPGSPAGH